MNNLTQPLARSLSIFVASLVFGTTVANAHHSYAIYDIDNKIERVGILK